MSTRPTKIKKIEKFEYETSQKTTDLKTTFNFPNLKFFSLIWEHFSHLSSFPHAAELETLIKFSEISLISEKKFLHLFHLSFPNLKHPIFFSILKIGLD